MIKNYYNKVWLELTDLDTDSRFLHIPPIEEDFLLYSTFQASHCLLLLEPMGNLDNLPILPSNDRE